MRYTLAAIKEVAAEMLANMETKQRANGESFVSFKDGSESNQWMVDAVHAAHGDRLPDDYIYATVQEFLEAIGEADAGDDLTEVVDGFADRVDIYNNDLTKWLHSNINNLAYVDEALQEYGPFDDGAKLLSTAQYLHRAEIANAIYGALASRSESLAK